MAGSKDHRKRKAGRKADKKKAKVGHAALVAHHLSTGRGTGTAADWRARARGGG